MENPDVADQESPNQERERFLKEDIKSQLLRQKVINVTTLKLEMSTI